MARIPATGGSSSRVSTRIWAKPAWVSVLEFVGGSGRGVSRGAGTAGLCGERDASCGPEQAPQIVEPFRRIGPEPHGIDGEDGIKRFVEAWQLVHCCRCSSRPWLRQSWRQAPRDSVTSPTSRGQWTDLVEDRAETVAFDLQIVAALQIEPESL
jgi:hypothetical protein